MKTKKQILNKKVTEAFVKKNTWFSGTTRMNLGWGNGYVVIPKGHKLHGKSYDEIHNLIPSLRVNGGLTFSKDANNLDWDELPENSKDGWVVGFDTAHYGDTFERWSKENVIAEAEKLKKQLEKYV
uniref:Uncharacterized protein n=1 Tax=viral metagenome TaxID=1070528 RepID=A0A6M3M5A3_9ZZZZ